MSMIHRKCRIFDPIRITTASENHGFIIDTWHEKGLMQRSLFSSLVGMSPVGDIRVMLSSGMYVTCPLVRVGVQIGCIRATPVEFALVDDGPAPLLFGSEFMERLFDMRAKGPSGHDVPDSVVSIDAPEKYSPETLGIRLVPEGDNVDAVQLERFLRSVRKIHNIGVLATTGLHQPEEGIAKQPTAKQDAVIATIEEDYNLRNGSLQITWVENGSIWLALASGSKKAFSWLAQLFEITTDARLRRAIANASSAEEEAAIKLLTREQLARAKNHEQERLTAKYIKETRREWQQTVLSEIDFRKKLAQDIKDEQVREIAMQQIDLAISDLVRSNFMPVVEHAPAIAPTDRDPLKLRSLGDENSV